jgi:hypothetical protein
METLECVALPVIPVIVEGPRFNIVKTTYYLLNIANGVCYGEARGGFFSISSKSSGLRIVFPAS